MAEEDSRKMVPFFSSSNHDAEMEATSIHSVLEANGIPSILVGPASLPSLEFQVQVSEERLADAVHAVAEARAAGPAAAAEAELESEKQS
jgi:2-keto-3-deoxy-L-rhamnonate aldolase RhmA